MVKNLPTVQETQIQSLGWEDPIEKGMATHSSILTWSIPWTEEPGSLHPWGHKELDTTERLSTAQHTSGKKKKKKLYRRKFVIVKLKNVFYVNL